MLFREKAYSMQIEFQKDGIRSHISISRDLTATLAGSTCGVELETPYNQPLSSQVQLFSAVAHHTTQQAFSYFTGFFNPKGVTPIAGGSVLKYRFTIKDILQFQDNKFIENYYQKSFAENIVNELLVLSGAADPDRSIKMFDIRFVYAQTEENEPIDVDPDSKVIAFNVDQPTSLSDCYKRFCKENGFTLEFQRARWLYIKDLGAGFPVLGTLVFRKNGKVNLWAPKKKIIIDPNMDLCGPDVFWEGQPTYSEEDPEFSQVLVAGINGLKTKRLEATFIDNERKIGIRKGTTEYPIQDGIIYIGDKAKLIY